MAEMDLKLRIVPDISLLKKAVKDLSKDATGGVEAGKKDEASKDSKKLLATVKSLFKVVGIVAIGALLISALLKPFEPIIKLLGVILSLLFLPLIPLLKPVLLILADMAKNIAESAGAFLSGDIGLGEFIAQVGSELITGFAAIVPVVLELFLQILNAFLEALPVLIPLLGEALEKVIAALVTFMPLFVDALIAFMEAVPVEKIIGALTTVILALIPFAGVLIEAFADFIAAIIPQIGKIVPSLVEAFVAIIEAMIPLIPQLMDSLIVVMDALLTAMFAAITGKIKNFFGFGGGGNETSVADAIIRPNGQIIRTDPADTLIATKDPGALGRSEGGFIFSPTINLNGAINSELDVRRMAEQIAQIGADALSRKTGSLRF